MTTMLEVIATMGHLIALWATCYLAVKFCTGMVQGWKRSRQEPDANEEPANIEVARRFWDGH